MKTLIDLAIVFTGAALVWHTLDIHDHACAACGTTWSHVGMFSAGSERAHRCACGAVQWWRVGEPVHEHVDASTRRVIG